VLAAQKATIVARSGLHRAKYNEALDWLMGVLPALREPAVL
jgi:hypothetical protein